MSNGFGPYGEFSLLHGSSFLPLTSSRRTPAPTIDVFDSRLHTFSSAIGTGFISGQDARQLMAEGVGAGIKQLKNPPLPLGETDNPDGGQELLW